MEFVGMTPDTFHFTVHIKAFNHSKRSQKSAKIAVADAAADFDRYDSIWIPERIDGFFNSRPVISFANTGKGIDDTIFSAEFHIDYVCACCRP